MKGDALEKLKVSLEKKKNEKVILIELQKQYNVQNMHTPHHLYLL